MNNIPNSFIEKKQRSLRIIGNPHVFHIQPICWSLWTKKRASQTKKKWTCCNIWFLFNYSNNQNTNIFGWTLHATFTWTCNIGCKSYVDSCKDSTEKHTNNKPKNTWPYYKLSKTYTKWYTYNNNGRERLNSVRNGSFIYIPFYKLTGKKLILNTNNVKPLCSN